MARINIEASAALAEWIDLARADNDAYLQLVDRAIACLPMTRRTATPTRSAFDGLRYPEVTSIIVASAPAERLAQRQIKRGAHRSVRSLEAAIRAYIEANNDDPKPFVWTKTADAILASIARFAQRTLKLHGLSEEGV